MTCPTGIGNLTINTIGDRIVDAFVCGIGTDTRIVASGAFALLLIVVFVAIFLFLLLRKLRAGR